MRKTYMKIKQAVELQAWDWYSALKAPKQEICFDSIQNFCLFIGYPRSGHSLVGSLLDAHPNIVIANELDVLRFFSRGMKKNQIFYLLLRNSKQYARQGRMQTGYNYDVPGQWQGRFEDLRVIGDKKGGMTTRRIGENDGLLDSVAETVGMPVKYVHVVRNPFDNITTMALRTQSTLEAEITHYFYLCRINAHIKARIRNQDLLELRHEDIIADPEKSLNRLTTFLGLGCPEEYSRACSNIVSKKPSQTRKKVDWPASLVSRVHEGIRGYDFLENYSYFS